ncbi:hypothetical protein L3V65_13745 [Heyndrickxia coagulans]|uniref:hypothetical protein n=1 Tax=Heyndrickxia coagulans TaxID=1398 RepID=UPI001F1E813D|nr:hypothetical protein [Heyndrickxia coagulans]UJZ87266.1 hypothetical protein L3V65_13745 [Heyndrickxia coagulans]
MQNKIYHILLYIIIIFLSFFSVKYFVENYKVVATVNGKKIHENEVQKIIKDRYFDTALDNCIDQKLLSLEKKKIQVPTNKQLHNEFKYYQLVNRNATNFDKNQKNVREFYYVSELIKKYTITDSELKNFVKQEYRLLGQKKDTIYILQSNHDTVNKVEKALKEGRDLKTVEKSYNVKFKRDIIFSKDNQYGIDFTNMKKGDTLHLHYGVEDKDMSNMSNMDMSSNNNKGESSPHTFIVIKNIENNDLIDLKKNRKEIINNYISSNFYKEKVDLDNYLREKYEIVKK